MTLNFLVMCFIVILFDLFINYFFKLTIIFIIIILFVLSSKHHLRIKWVVIFHSHILISCIWLRALILIIVKTYSKILVNAAVIHRLKVERIQIKEIIVILFLILSKFFFLESLIWLYF